MARGRREEIQRSPGIKGAVAFLISSAALLTLIYTIYRDTAPATPATVHVTAMSLSSATEFMYSRQSNSVISLSDVEGQGNQGNSFYEGIGLFTAINNQAASERIIVTLEIRATNIVQNNMPRLTTAPDVECNTAIVNIYNWGWGCATNLMFSFKEIMFYGEGTDKGKVTVSNPQIYDNKVISTLGSGESEKVYLATVSDFSVLDFSQGSIYCSLIYDVNYAEGAQSQEFEIPVVFNADGSMSCVGFGALDFSCVPISIDASKQEDIQKFTTFAYLPASQAVLIPIYIKPTRSCSMNLNVILEMDNGEKIEVINSDGVEIEVPYGITSSKVPGELISFPYDGVDVLHINEE